MGELYTHLVFTAFVRHVLLTGTSESFTILRSCIIWYWRFSLLYLQRKLAWFKKKLCLYDRVRLKGHRYSSFSQYHFVENRDLGEIGLIYDWELYLSVYLFFSKQRNSVSVGKLIRHMAKNLENTKILTMTHTKKCTST